MIKPAMDRRAFLGTAVASAPILRHISKSSVRAAERSDRVAVGARSELPGMIMREREPRNLEFPFPTLDGPIVPNHRFFVRGHFPIPKIDRASWRLKITGHVGREFELSYDEIRSLPARTVTTTLECAGNSRGFLVPKANGVPWELGGVGNAEWTGVPLSTVLDRAGIREGAVDVILEGTDKGEINDDPKTPGPVPFARSLPLAKARRPEVLLAYRMNGEELPIEHGFPLRAIVAGWYGMASVKWLTRIAVSPSSFQGYWQTAHYAYWNRDFGLPTMVPVTEMSVKAEISRPCLHEVVPPDTPYRVFGAAWAGEADVVKVELSADGGRGWQKAKLLGRVTPFAWRLWELDWRSPAQRGMCQLIARATDSRGRTQPATHSRDNRAYRIHHLLPIEIEVR